MRTFFIIRENIIGKNIMEIEYRKKGLQISSMSGRGVSFATSGGGVEMTKLVCISTDCYYAHNGSNKKTN